MKTLCITLTLCLAFACSANSQTISVSFAGDNAGGQSLNLTGDDIAGVVPVSNWNADAQGATGSIAALVDSTGTATTAEVSWAGSNNTWGGTAGTNPDELMVNGWLDDNGTGSQIDITGIPYASYDLYVYGSSDAGNAGRGMNVQVNGTDYFSGGVFLDPVTESGGSFYTGYVDAATTADNPSYFKISGLSGSDLSILGARNASGPELANASTDYRGGISGFQINAVPEPASLSMAVLMSIGLLSVRRRR